MQGSHIHTPDDGRGKREVYLNGTILAELVCYADTRRGIVRIYRRPIRLDKHGKRLLTMTLRGIVEVKEKSNENNMGGVGAI